MAEGVGSYEEVVKLMENPYTISDTYYKLHESKFIESRMAEYLFECYHARFYHYIYDHFGLFLSEDAKDRLALIDPSLLITYVSLTKEQSIVCAERVKGSVVKTKSIYPESQIILLNRRFLSYDHKDLTTEVLAVMERHVCVNGEWLWFLKFTNDPLSWFTQLKFTPKQCSDSIVYMIVNIIEAEYVRRCKKLQPFIDDAVKEKICSLQIKFFSEYFPTPTRDQLLRFADRLSIKSIPTHELDEELLTIYVSTDGHRLIHIDLALRTDQVCQKALDATPLALKYVPKALRTLKRCQEAYRRDIKCLPSIPKNLREKIV